MAERHCPHITLPKSAYVPGQSKHPQGLFEGLWPTLTHFGQDNWRKATPYLLGFDLYHGGYYWEAHEVWEEVWHLCKKQPGSGPLVQSLIFLTASRLKWHMGEELQAERMIKRARELASDCVQSEIWLGIHLKSYIAQLSKTTQESPELTLNR